MSTINLRRNQNGTFSPVTELDVKRLSQVHPLDEILVEYSPARNAAFHRKGFKLINVLFDNQDKFTVKQHFYNYLLISIGHCDAYITPEGETQYHVKSLAFDRCDDTEFAELYEKILTFGVEKLGINAALEFA